MVYSQCVCVCVGRQKHPSPDVSTRGEGDGIQPVGGEETKEVTEVESCSKSTPSSSSTSSSSSSSSSSDEAPEPRPLRPHRKGPRNGRWGSFQFSIVKGDDTEAFFVHCPVHSCAGSPGEKKVQCSRQRFWNINGGEAERDDVIRGLMQWAAVTHMCANKDEHMGYMKTLKERQAMLMPQEQIERTRESHGWSDDESYCPLTAARDAS